MNLIMKKSRYPGQRLRLTEGRIAEQMTARQGLRGTLCLLLLGALLLLSACGRAELTVSGTGSLPLPRVQEEDGSVTKTEATRSLPYDGWYVQVTGAVVKPGVYRIEPDSRVFQLIELAGGLAEEADVSAINQALRLRDGQQLYIPTRAEVEASREGVGTAGYAQPGAVQTEAGAAAAADLSGTRININTATAEQLCSLPGIGEAKAADIIAYREQKGGFTDPEQLMEIAGIKKGVYENIKDRIDIQ